MHLAYEERKHLPNDHEKENEQDKSEEEEESKENTKKEGTIIDLAAVKEVVAKRPKQQTTRSRGIGRRPGRRNRLSRT